MITVKKISDLNSNEAEQMFAIRRAVFVDEQKVDHHLEYDAHESACTHYLAAYNNTPCGAARWRHTPGGIKLERFAVLKEYRGKHIGLALLTAVLNDVLPHGKKIYLHAQLSACGFYERHGFVKQGDHFWEANMEHVAMVYKDIMD